MGLPAFSAYERGETSQAFGAVVAFPARISMQEIQPLQASEPGPMQKLEMAGRGVSAQIDQTLGGAVEAHKRAVRAHGFADAQAGRAANLFNPAKDGMVFASAAVMPAFASVASALLVASALSYANADRRSKKRRTELEERVRAEQSSKSRGFDDVQWGKPGFHKVDVANENHPPLRRTDILYLEQDIENQPFFRVLAAQKAVMRNFEAANHNRQQKGLPHSRRTYDAMLAQDSLYLRDDFDMPVPAQT